MMSVSMSEDIDNDLHTGEGDAKPVSAPKITLVSEEILAEGRFLNLSRYTYKDQCGKEKVCEVAGRVGSVASSPPSANCVGSLAVLRRMLKYDCIILVKQYRPQLKKYTLELPAGFTAASETAEETAERELKEETGYSSPLIKHTSPLTALDPGLSECTMQVVTLEVDGDVAKNYNPKQADDDSKSIEVIEIPIHELLSRLNEFSKQGIIIDSRVYCFAIGLTVGAKNSSYIQIANQY